MPLSVSTWGATMSSEEVFDEHSYSLASKTHVDLRCLCPALSDIVLNLPPLPPEILQVHISNKDVSEELEIQNKNPFPFAVGDVFQAPVLSAKFLTQGDDVKEVIEVSLDISLKDPAVEFLPGDTIGIIPCNSDHDVDQILQYLGLIEEAKKEYTIEVKEGTPSKKKPTIPPHIPPRGSLRHVLKTCVDFRSVPKKVFLRVLAEHTSDPNEKRRLEELCSRQGASEYTKFILEANTNVLELLTTFRSCQPPAARLLEQLPRLLPRPYSIASSPLAHPTRVRVVLSVVEQPRLGLCSGWLKNTLLFPECPDLLEQQLENLSLDSKPSETKIPIFFRKPNGFHLPNDPSVPLILIGPGTGVAPFVGFLEHRAEQQKSTINEAGFGEIWLFFGCRYSTNDFLYRCGLLELLDNGVLSRLFTSFSRDKISGDQPRYVQDNIKLHSKEFVHQLLHNKSMLFVCGDANSMAKDVLETIVAVIQAEQGIVEAEARAVVCDLQKTGRYLQDIWT